MKTSDSYVCLKENKNNPLFIKKEKYKVWDVNEKSDHVSVEGKFYPYLTIKKILVTRLLAEESLIWRKEKELFV